jgi:hypothetical protein
MSHEEKRSVTIDSTPEGLYFACAKVIEALQKRLEEIGGNRAA